MHFIQLEQIGRAPDKCILGHFNKEIERLIRINTRNPSDSKMPQHLKGLDQTLHRRVFMLGTNSRVKLEIKGRTERRKTLSDADHGNRTEHDSPFRVE